MKGRGKEGKEGRKGNEMKGTGKEREELTARPLPINTTINSVNVIFYPTLQHSSKCLMHNFTY